MLSYWIGYEKSAHFLLKKLSHYKEQCMINGCENVSVVLETKQRSDQVCSKIYKN